MADPCLALRCGDLDVCLGQVPVIRGASFDCCEGAWVVIGGPVDSGRSRLLSTVDGLCPPSGGGGIWVLGPRVLDRAQHDEAHVMQRARTVSREFALLETLTSRGNVEPGVGGGGVVRKEVARRRAEERLERLELELKLNELPMRRPDYGRQRVALARALVPRARPLILDEPTPSLQRSAARIVMEAIRSLVDAGAIVVMPDSDADVGGLFRAWHLELVPGGRPPGRCS